MICISTTSDSKEVLKKISKLLIENKLSACNKISEVESEFIWNKQRHSTLEYKLEVKTIDKLESLVIKCINENHNYEVFELIKFNFEILNPSYEKWFVDQLTK